MKSLRSESSKCLTGFSVFLLCFNLYYFFFTKQKIYIYKSWRKRISIYFIRVLPLPPRRSRSTYKRTMTQMHMLNSTRYFFPVRHPSGSFVFLENLSARRFVCGKNAIIDCLDKIKDSNFLSGLSLEHVIHLRSWRESDEMRDFSE